ncbi:MAG: TrmH family RNA methyltransferase [Clostridia bacterium]|nr:TrmH family RNA methyltransferase [Clostridia bacterium]
MSDFKTNNNDMRLKPYRKDFTYSYSCGVFPTIELLTSCPDDVIKLIITEKGLSNSGVQKLITIAEQKGIPYTVDSKTAERLYPKENSYAIGAFNKYTCSLCPDKNHIVLVNPSDKGNLGTIIRTLTAFGIEDIAIISPAADIYDPKVIRASMGAVFKIRFQMFDSFDAYRKFLQDTVERSYFPFMLNGQPLETAKKPQSGVFSLIFGNEASGLDDSFLSIGTPVRIMHLDTVDSLNLTIAAAIGIYNFTQGDF